LYIHQFFIKKKYRNFFIYYEKFGTKSLGCNSCQFKWTMVIWFCDYFKDWNLFKKNSIDPIKSFDVVTKYFKSIKDLCTKSEENKKSNVKFVYTAMHGVGYPFAVEGFFHLHFFFFFFNKNQNRRKLIQIFLLIQ